MVSIDPKALEHACLCAGRSVHHFDRMGDDLPLRASIVAHARAIERLEATEARHAAELREQAERFSEVARTALAEALKADTYANERAAIIGPILAPFILPAPDPLVEYLVEVEGYFPRVAKEFADRLRLATREGKIVWEAGE